MVGPSLDRFINKIVIKNILFMTKRSRLEVKKTSVRLSNGQNKMADHLKAGPKKCPRDGHSNAGSSSFRMYIYCIQMVRISNGQFIAIKWPENLTIVLFSSDTNQNGCWIASNILKLDNYSSFQVIRNKTGSQKWSNIRMSGLSWNVPFRIPESTGL
jgi:hypothetical protein